MEENKINKVFGIILALEDGKFKYLSKIPGGEIRIYETLLTSLTRQCEEIGIDISEIQPVFLCFKEKPRSIDFYYALPVDSTSLTEFVETDSKEGFKIFEHIDQELENEILKKIIKR